MSLCSAYLAHAKLLERTYDARMKRRRIAARLAEVERRTTTTAEFAVAK